MDAAAAFARRVVADDTVEDLRRRVGATKDTAAVLGVVTVGDGESLNDGFILIADGDDAVGAASVNDCFFRPVFRNDVKGLGILAVDPEILTVFPIADQDSVAVCCCLERSANR